MALGGGMYTVQNKVLPGAYINFVSAARASATLGDRGTAAFLLSLDWGPENEVVTIENSEFQKGSLALTGYAYTADELRPLREIFANAKTLHLFRLNSGGAKAACKYAEAKYPGKIGNELKIVIQQNEGFTASTNEVYDVSTYIGTTLVDTQKAVKAVSDLSDNDYLHWKGSEALTENAGLLLTGGCADPYGWKAVRSSMGAVFRRPIYSGTPEELAALLHRSGLPLYGAALREDTVDARQADYTRCVLAIGSEGRGLSREVLDLCDQTIRIPMSDRCESLNAAIAAAVLLWESWR